MEDIVDIKEKWEGTYMAKESNKYFESLTEDICRFYVQNRAGCLEQYNKAENPNLYDVYETINDEKEQEMLFAQVSIIVLTANKYEKNVLHAHMTASTELKIKRLSISLFPQHESQQETYAYFFKWHDYSILHIEAQATGSYTMGGAADVVRFVLSNPCLYPTVIISLGICFGVDEHRQTLGDTVISEKVYPYFMGAKWDEASYVVTDDNRFRIESRLKSKLQSEIIHTNVFKFLDFKVELGNYITGEAVISNKDIRELFTNITTQSISAGEMEGYGLFKECWGANYILPCLIIKSICDWGVLKNFTHLPVARQILVEHKIDEKELDFVKDSLQAYASFHAYCVLDLLIQKRVFSPSIYSQLHSKIERSGEIERSIFKNSILQYANQIAQDMLGVKTISEPFINSCIDIMIQKQLLLLLNEGDSLIDCNQTAWRINLVN